MKAYTFISYTYSTLLVLLYAFISSLSLFSSGCIIDLLSKFMMSFIDKWPSERVRGYESVILSMCLSRKLGWLCVFGVVAQENISRLNYRSNDMPCPALICLQFSISCICSVSPHGFALMTNNNLIFFE